MKRLFDTTVCYRGRIRAWGRAFDDAIAVYWWPADPDEHRSPDGLWPEGPTARGEFVWSKDFGWIQASGPEAPAEVVDYLDDEINVSGFDRLPMEGDC